MKVSDLINYFGSPTKAARFIDVTNQCISRWKKLGYIPIAHQHKIQDLTGGDLKVTTKEVPEPKYGKKSKRWSKAV